MKRCILFCALVLVALTAGNLGAVQTACPANATFDVLAGFNSLANACFSQDKLFWNFVYTPTGNAGAASTVSGGLIFAAQPGTDIHGWNFSSSNWVQGVLPAQFTISYTIQVCPAGSVCVGNVIPGTVISGADAVYAPVSTFLPGPETVTWSQGSSPTVTLTSGSPGALPPGANIGLGAGVTTPITVTANFSGTGAITQTTLRFYETLGTLQTPEPGSLAMILGGAGLIELGSFRRRKRAL